MSTPSQGPATPEQTAVITREDGGAVVSAEALEAQQNAPARPTVKVGNQLEF